MTAPMIKPQEDPNQIVPMSENDQGAWLQNMISPEAIQALGQKQHAERMRKINPNYDPNIEPLAQIQPRQIQMDREKFSEVVFQQMGGNPWMENPKNMALQEFSSQLPAIWKKVFPNIPWGGRLDDDQMKYWQNVKLQAYNMAVNNFVSANDQKKETYRFAIGEFEKKKLDMEKAGEETRKLSYLRKELEVRKEFEKPSLTPEETEAKQKRMVEFKAETKAKHRQPKEPTGGLTENQVAQSLQDLSMSDTTSGGTVQERYAKYYDQFRQLVSTGLSREDALNQVLKKGAKLIKKEISKGQKDHSYLWR